MKKLFVFMSIACAITACSTDDAMDGSVKSENKVSSEQAGRISYDEALAKAKASVSEIEDGQNRTLDLSNGVKAITQNGNDTLMYVFNFKDNKGYAAISATKKAPNFKIISEKGSLDPTNVQDSATINWTRNFFVKTVNGVKTRGERYEYPDPSGTVRYKYVEQYVLQANIASNQTKKSIFSDYYYNRNSNITKVSCSMNSSEYTKAVSTSNDYALCFSVGSSRYYATGYGVIRETQYWEVKYPGSSYYTTGGICTSYDRGSYYTYTNINGTTSTITNLNSIGYAYRVSKKVVPEKNNNIFTYSGFDQLNKKIKIIYSTNASAKSAGIKVSNSSYSDVISIPTSTSRKESSLDVSKYKGKGTLNVTFMVDNKAIKQEGNFCVY